MKKLITALISAAVLAMPLALVSTPASAQTAMPEQTAKAPKAKKIKSTKKAHKTKAKIHKMNKATDMPAK